MSTIFSFSAAKNNLHFNDKKSESKNKTKKQKWIKSYILRLKFSSFNCSVLTTKMLIILSVLLLMPALNFSLSERNCLTVCSYYIPPFTYFNISILHFRNILCKSFPFFQHYVVNLFFYFSFKYYLFNI